MHPDNPSFYLALGLLVAVSAAVLIRQWWTWNEPNTRLRRDWKRSTKRWK